MWQSGWRVKRKRSIAVLQELDKVILQILDEIRPNGVPPSDEEKRYGLKAFKQSPGYKAVTRAVQGGSEEELEKAAQTVRRKFLAAFRKPLLDAIKRLPYPPGGRRKALSHNDELQVCSKIGSLIVGGCTLKEAVRRLADRFGVSRSTIYRTWRNRPKNRG
jgi:DNA invertase Pin-like site-specific DNA recombinase